MRRRGFTIVELVVVMTVMAILLTLGVFGLQKSQANARDAERRSDVETIARGLEERYKNGNTLAYYDDGTGTIGGKDWDKAGQYPGTNEIFHIGGFVKPGWYFYGDDLTGKDYYEDAFSGASKASFTSPTGQVLALDCIWACQPAGSPTQYLDGINADGNKAGEGVNTGAYVYEPIDKDGNICCCGGCVRFDIYYKDEAGAVQKVSSQRQ